MSEVQIEGEAHLCFPQDGSWFQGHLDTNDHSQFTIYGSRETVDATNMSGVEPSVYTVKLLDHDQGTAHDLGKIGSNRNGGSQCQLQSQQVIFESDSSFGGQKAALMIQHFLPMDRRLNLVPTQPRRHSGTGVAPIGGGTGFVVFVGHMKISFNQEEMANRMWTL